MQTDEQVGPFDETALRLKAGVASATAGAQASPLSFTELKQRIEEARRAGRPGLHVPGPVPDKVRRSLRAAGLRIDFIVQGGTDQTEIRFSTGGPVRLQED